MSDIPAPPDITGIFREAIQGVEKIAKEVGKEISNERADAEGLRIEHDAHGELQALAPLAQDLSGPSTESPALTDEERADGVWPFGDPGAQQEPWIEGGLGNEPRHTGSV